MELGPHNVEALKLKAALFSHVGRFEDEELAWRRIIEIDNEDEDAIHYFQGAQLEDREHYYFTDALPGGGRRFLAYPRALVSVSFIGLVGCVSFLLFTRTSGNSLIGQSPALLLSAFSLMVVAPWVAIIYLYVKTIRHVSVSQQGFEVATRFRTIAYPWREIERISLAYSDDLETSELKLVVVPRDKALASLSIDFTEAKSSVRARRYLLTEIRDYFQNIHHDPSSTLKLDPKALLRF